MNHPNPLTPINPLNPSNFELSVVLVNREYLNDPYVFDAEGDALDYLQYKKLNQITKGYDLGVTRMTLELLVTEDFNDRTDWLLRDYETQNLALMFKLKLLNASGIPVMYHQGIALNCELDTFAQGYVNNDIDLDLEVGGTALSVVPNQMIANLAFTKLQQVRFYQKV